MSRPDYIIRLDRIGPTTYIGPFGSTRAAGEYNVAYLRGRGVVVELLDPAHACDEPPPRTVCLCKECGPDVEIDEHYRCGRCLAPMIGFWRLSDGGTMYLLGRADEPCSCHSGSVCGAACRTSHHAGCPEAEPHGGHRP